MIIMCLLLCVVPFLVVVQRSRWIPSQILWLLNPLEVVKKNDGLSSKQMRVFYVHHFGVKPLGEKTVHENINFILFIGAFGRPTYISMCIVPCLHRL